MNKKTTYIKEEPTMKRRSTHPPGAPPLNRLLSLLLSFSLVLSSIIIPQSAWARRRGDNGIDPVMGNLKEVVLYISMDLLDESADRAIALHNQLEGEYESYSAMQEGEIVRIELGLTTLEYISLELYTNTGETPQAIAEYSDAEIEQMLGEYIGLIYGS